MAVVYEEDDDMTCFFAPATKKMQGIFLATMLCDDGASGCGKLKILENTLKIMTSGSGQYKY
ncbi:hypothetical protein EJB05_53090, partial [Eragrostis curvula]